MKTALRASAAALALVAPLAAFVAQPVQAQGYPAVVANTPYYGGYDRRYDDAGRWQRGDRVAPQIFAMTASSPGDGGARNRFVNRSATRISARVADQGSGVDAFRLRVDGRDVTGAAAFDGDQVTYAEVLPRGRHTADLEVRDRAGNVARQSWSFFSEGAAYAERDERGYGWGRRYDDRRW